jgi:hypothetical protein
LWIYTPYLPAWETRDLGAWADALAPNIVLHSQIPQTPFKACGDQTKRVAADTPPWPISSVLVRSMSTVLVRSISPIIETAGSPPTRLVQRRAARIAGALLVALVCFAGAAGGASAAGLVVTVQPPPVVEGQVFNGTVATVVDTSAFGGADLASNYSAKIAWGDGVTSTATVIAGSGEFSIATSGAGHTYAEEGTYLMTVEVTDEDGSSGSASSTFTVADAPLSAAPVAAPVAFEGTGAGTTVGLSVFETAIGGTDNHAAVGEQGGGFRKVNWDEVKLDGSDSGGATTTIAASHVVAIADDRFASRGIDLRAPIAVAGDGFLSVNSFVSGRFPAFSAPNIAAPFNGNSAALDIVAPAGPGNTPTPAATRGFGAVFLNVRLPNTTSIEYFSGETMLARAFAPVGGAGLPSFVGELFASPVVTSVVINLGTAQIFSFDGTTFAPGVESSEGLSNNLVAMDDLALAEPAPEAPALSGTAGTPVSAAASFSDSDPNASAGDFTASIDWGDGTRSGGHVTAAGSGGFTVVGGHTYPVAGTFAVAISAQDLGGAKRTFHTTATVAAAVSSPPPASSLPPSSTSLPRSPPRCSLSRPSVTFARIGVAVRARHGHGTQDLIVRRLEAIARCDQSASALLTAVASLTPAHKAHTLHGGVRTKGAISLGQVRASLSENVSAKLAIALTAAASAKLRSAVAQHQRVSVTMTLSAANGNGATSASASVANLKLR